jgi:hypothetical protein
MIAQSAAIGCSMLDVGRWMFCAPSGRCLDPTIRVGRCGDWVYYRLRGNKQYRRRWVRPKDPRTPAQLQNRARLGTASRHYSALLTEEEQDACVAAGAKRQSRPRLGQSGSLTGQQYSVHKANAKNATAKGQNTGIPAQVTQPQRLTRPTWGLHRGGAGVPPGQRERGWGVTGRRQGARGASELHEQQRVTRATGERYRNGSALALVRHRRGTGSARALRARLMQRMGVRPLPARRPAAQPCAAPARGPSGQFDAGNWCPRLPR